MDITADLTFIRIAGEQFDEYVNTEALFYPIGSVSRMTMPQFTIGAWLEAVWRVRAVESTLNAEQRATLDNAVDSAQRVRRLWPALYAQKAQRDFKSRLDSWTWYLDDVLNPSAGVSSKGAGYATQAHIRFKLALLAQDVPQPPQHTALLETCDRRLRTRFVAGPFIWETVLQPAAPPDTFWFLYGHPAVN